jgi:flagellar biosynthesis/type III secretory pathway M-ring protein FliF/YscJ
MRWLTFTVFNAIGACAWVATWVSIGYLAGDHIDPIYANMNHAALYVLIALAVLLAAFIAWRLLRRRKRARQPEPEPELAPEAVEQELAPEAVQQDQAATAAERQEGS